MLVLLAPTCAAYSSGSAASSESRSTLTNKLVSLQSIPDNSSEFQPLPTSSSTSVNQSLPSSTASTSESSSESERSRSSGMSESSSGSMKKAPSSSESDSTMLAAPVFFDESSFLTKGLGHLF